MSAEQAIVLNLGTLTQLMTLPKPQHSVPSPDTLIRIIRKQLSQTSNHTLESQLRQLEGQWRFKQRQRHCLLL